MIDIALHYANKGWPIFPLVPSGKTPVISVREGGHGFLDATTSTTAIERWWARWPEANVGIATGTRSGVIVIDVDTKKGKDGLASIQKLMPTPTLTIRTPSGGFHLYYRMPATPIGSGQDLMPGVDWRGDGGYVVGPGSSTELGMYLIARNLSIVDLPVNISELLKKTRHLASKVSPFSPRKWFNDRKRLCGALAYIDPEDYTTWLEVGMAIHKASGSSDDGFELWNAWSAGELTAKSVPNYAGTDMCRRKWHSFNTKGNKRGAVTLGTIFVHAQEAGYQRPVRAV